MKIRQGFVSNSSSSSFLIRTDGKYKTVYDVAKQVMLDMQYQWRDDDYSYSDELKQLESMPSKDTPVYFDSSDGGYIRKFKDYIIVSSTQHYDETASFNDDIVSLKDIGVEYFKELEWFDEEYEEYEDEDCVRKIEYNEDFDYYWQQFNDFLLLKSGIYGVWEYDFKKERTDCDCKSCRVVRMKNDEVICGCKATKIYSRKLKLDKIKKDEN